MKLLINILASALLLLHMRPIVTIARAASAAALAPGELGRLRTQVTADAGAALVALLVATVLSIYKPRGLTRYGWRRLRQPAEKTNAASP